MRQMLKSSTLSGEEIYKMKEYQEPRSSHYKFGAGSMHFSPQLNDICDLSLFSSFLSVFSRPS